MLLAHLRGLLEPYYKQGIRSIFAEKMMLTALAAEVQSEYEGRFLQLQASFAAAASPQGAQQMYAHLTGGFVGVVDRALLDFTRTPERVSRDSKGLIAFFKALESSGFFNKLNKATEEVLRHHPMRRN